MCLSCAQKYVCVEEERAPEIKWRPAYSRDKRGTLSFQGLSAAETEDMFGMERYLRYYKCRFKGNEALLKYHMELMRSSCIVRATNSIGEHDIRIMCCPEDVKCSSNDANHWTPVNRRSSDVHIPYTRHHLTTQRREHLTPLTCQLDKDCPGEKLWRLCECCQVPLCHKCISTLPGNACRH